MHGNRGRIPAHALTPETAASVAHLYRTKYEGFNFTHFTEKLVEVEGIAVSRSSVRRVLHSAGYASPRKRRAPKHRSRRERRACEGAMLQLDGSHHDWLEGRGPSLCLLGGIDDATGKVLGAVFREHEDAHGYLPFDVTDGWQARLYLPGMLPFSNIANRRSVPNTPIENTTQNAGLEF